MRPPALVCVALAVGACGFTGGGELPRDALVTDARPGDATGSEGVIDAPPPDTGTEVCPPNYAAIAGATTSKYKFVNAPQQSWIDAEIDCASDAMAGHLATHLAVLDDAGELAALTTTIDDQWIGLSDLGQEGSFAYVTLESPTLPVTALMGTNAANKDCIRIKTSQALEIRDCDETNKYVCECDGIRPTPAQFPNPPDGNP